MAGGVGPEAHAASAAPSVDPVGRAGGREWGSRLATAAACLSAGIAIFAAYSTYNQIDIAKRQNEVADRQSLGALVADITTQRRVLEKTTGLQRLVVEQAILADAEEAFALVETLTKPVPAVDNYEIGSAFEGASEYHNALASFRRATRTTIDPHYRASSLRGEAKILYTLGGSANVARARIAVGRAYHSFDGEPDVSRATVEGNYAFTDLFAAGYEAMVDCGRARAQLDTGKRLIRAKPYIDTPAATVAQKYAESTIARCG